MKKEIIEKICQSCEQYFDLENLKLSDSYYYASLPLCVIDAVFSIGVKYASTQNVVDHYCAYFHQPKYLSQVYGCQTDHTISQLIDNIEAVGVENAANYIFRNHQRTSTKNGILKAEAVLRFAKILKKYGVETFDGLRYENLPPGMEKKIRMIPGQKSGLSFHYFCMLVGDDTQAKPDRHVLRFLKESTGKDFSIVEVQEILTATVDQLKELYPNLSVRLLDHAIWNYMAHKQTKKEERQYNKLVRDRIPEIIKAGGKSCEIKILDDEEYLRMVDAKLDEELAEYH